MEAKFRFLPGILLTKQINFNRYLKDLQNIINQLKAPFIQFGLIGTQLEKEFICRGHQFSVCKIYLDDNLCRNNEIKPEKCQNHQYIYAALVINRSFNPDQQEEVLKLQTKIDTLKNTDNQKNPIDIMRLLGYSYQVTQENGICKLTLILPLYAMNVRKDAFEQLNLSISNPKEKLQMDQFLSNLKIKQEPHNLVQSEENQYLQTQEVETADFLKLLHMEDQPFYKNYHSRLQMKQNLEVRRQEIILKAIEYILNPSTESSDLIASSTIKILYDFSLIMTPDQQTLQESEKEFEALFENSKTQEEMDEIEFVLLSLNLHFKKSKTQLIFSRKSTDNDMETLSLHLMATDEITQDLSSVYIEENRNMNFRILMENEGKLHFFQKIFTSEIAQGLKIEENNVLILSIINYNTEIQVDCQVFLNDVWTEIPEQFRQEIAQKLKEHYYTDVFIQTQKFFEFCWISPEQIDIRGNFDFSKKADIQKRGGIQYFQPLGYQRFGLNVLGRYGPSDQWLNLEGSSQQWAVAYHGTRSDKELKLVQNSKQPAHGQYYKDYICVKTGLRVGIGSYLSPHVEVAQAYCDDQIFKIGQHRYLLVFQCRVKPSEIRVPQRESYYFEQRKMDDWNNDYWVVNQCFVRPYGILIKQF